MDFCWTVWLLAAIFSGVSSLFARKIESNYFFHSNCTTLLYACMWITRSWPTWIWADSTSCNRVSAPKELVNFARSSATPLHSRKTRWAISWSIVTQYHNLVRSELISSWSEATSQHFNKSGVKRKTYHHQTGVFLKHRTYPQRRNPFGAGAGNIISGVTSVGWSIKSRPRPQINGLCVCR